MKSFPNLGRLLASGTSSLEGNNVIVEPATEIEPSPTPAVSEPIAAAEPTLQQTEEPVQLLPKEEVPKEPGPPAIVRNPATSGGSIQFLIDGDLYQLAAGEELRLPGNARVLLEFHRGGDFGEEERQLSTPGVYLFEPTRKGWVLKFTP